MRLELCFLTMICAAAAAADQTVTAIPIPATIADTAVPALSCIEPNLSDISKLTTKQFIALQTQIKAYGDCMRQYIDERHAKGNLYVNLQKAEVDAGNAAVKALNTFFAQVRELQNRQHPQSAPKSTSH